MSGRGALKGAAHSLVDTFVSRNNDVSGYWGIGMLYREAREHRTSKVVIDLGQDVAFPDGLVARAELARYRGYLANLLSRLHLSSSNVVGVTVTVEFGTFGGLDEPRWLSYGDPFVCTVSITSARGGSYKAIKVGRVAPHNPERELRSTRANAL